MSWRGLPAAGCAGRAFPKRRSLALWGFVFWLSFWAGHGGDLRADRCHSISLRRGWPKHLKRVWAGATQSRSEEPSLSAAEEGLPALRLRDIIVRDEYGLVVASAPKAEVGLSGLALLTGQLQAKRLSLIGAMMSVRIEHDGGVTIFAGSDVRPIATAPPAHPQPSVAVNEEASQSTESSSAMPPPRSGRPFRTAWLQSVAGLSALMCSGLMAANVSEVGLKNGSVAVDDARTGKRWMFGDIELERASAQRGGDCPRGPLDRYGWALVAHCNR